MAYVEKLKDDFLTCPLCLELFKEPKMLHCQHTFCLECLQRYFPTQQGAPYSQRFCPVCKEPTTVPHELQRMRNNFLVAGLVQFATSQDHHQAGSTIHGNMPTAPPQKTCPACEEQNNSVSFCGQCVIWLCAPCTRNHGKLPPTKDHIVLSLADIHEQQRGRLEQLEQTLDKLCEETDAQCDLIQQQREVIVNHHQQAVAEVNGAADQIQAIIESKRDELLIQLTGIMSSTDDTLNKVLLEVENRKSQLDRARRNVREAQGSEDASSVLLAFLDLQQTMRHLPPLVDIPAGVSASCGVQFRQIQGMLSALKADPLGRIVTLGQPSVLEGRTFPRDGPQPTFQLLEHMSSSFISGVTTFKLYGTVNTVFVIGYQQVYRLGAVGSGGRARVFADNNKFWKKPWGVAVAPGERVLISDSGSGLGFGTVGVYDFDGSFNSYMASGLSLPRGIAVYSMGLVLLCDQEDRCVYIFDIHKHFGLVKVLKRDSTGKHLFEAPMHVAVASNLDIIVSDAGHTIKSFSPSLELKATYRSPFPYSEFWGVCTNPMRHVFVADWNYGVHVLNNTDDLLFDGFLKDPNAGRILEPSAVNFDVQTGRLIVGNSSSQIYAVKLK